MKLAIDSPGFLTLVCNLNLSDDFGRLWIEMLFQFRDQVLKCLFTRLHWSDKMLQEFVGVAPTTERNTAHFLPGSVIAFASKNYT